MGEKSDRRPWLDRLGDSCRLHRGWRTSDLQRHGRVPLHALHAECKHVRLMDDSRMQCTGDNTVREMKMCPGGAGLVVLTRRNEFRSTGSLDQSAFKPRMLGKIDGKYVAFCGALETLKEIIVQFLSP